MCGIAGIWQFNKQPVNMDTLKRFTDAMQHRGPDGAGYELLENSTLGFGHRRLSIIDLSEKGKQPMSYMDGRYWITFNGEVFNFLQLKAELINFGYTFKSDTDTEIILAAYHKWGKECLRRFNGMWAIAIYDTQNKTMFMARDRYGIKPLHYIYKAGELLAFASETIAFKKLNGYSRKISYNNLGYAIDNNNILEGIGHTIYEGILQVLPGHYMEIKYDLAPRQVRWWNTLKEKVEVPKTYGEQVEEFKSIFEDACKLRLISDVPVGTALSGGVDSSSVYCMINYLVNNNKTVRSHENNKTAFCATFAGTEVDEKKYAEKVIDYTKGNVKYIEPDYSNLTQNILESTKLFDSMTGTPLYSILEVYKGMKRNGYTVSMDGHGGDEILYGYTPTVFQVVMHAFETQNTELEAEAVDAYLNMFPVETIKGNSVWLNSIKSQVQKQNTLFGKSKTLVKKMIGKDSKKNSLFYSDNTWINTGQINFNLPGLSDSPYSYSGLNRAESILAKDFCLLNIPYNLRDFDRAAMQTGIEIRMPLMDYRLVQYAFSLPFSAKFGNGVTKLILRDAMKGLMPEEIRMRKNKMGFTAPVKKWLSEDMNEFVKDHVRSSEFLQMPFLNKKIFQKEFDEFFGKPDTDTSYYVRLWELLNASIIINNN